MENCKGTRDAYTDQMESSISMKRGKELPQYMAAVIGMQFGAFCEF
jgi:hypothetical protein